MEETCNFLIIISPSGNKVQYKCRIYDDTSISGPRRLWPPFKLRTAGPHQTLHLNWSVLLLSVETMYVQSVNISEPDTESERLMEAKANLISIIRWFKVHFHLDGVQRKAFTHKLTDFSRDSCRYDARNEGVHFNKLDPNLRRLTHSDQRQNIITFWTDENW